MTVAPALPATSLRGIFMIFLRLGCISFGGPSAHLGYFHAEIIAKRKWMSERDYADLIALCQFLPGPASSQVGLSLGLARGGKCGALAAWAGFTLPSAILLVLFAIGLSVWGAGVPPGLITGLTLVAAAVVAKAVWVMQGKLCPDTVRRGIALVSAAIIIGLSRVLPLYALQLGVIIMAALAGLMLFSKPSESAKAAPTAARGGLPYLAVFAALLIGLPVLTQLYPSLWTDMGDAFYRTGATVFGGGHVVLPLLEAQTVTPGWISADNFLAGYGAAQAVPGPLFTFSAFVGASTLGVGGAALALGAIYMPSFLLVFGVMPYWERVKGHRHLRAALSGVNAAVVGLLLAALWDPVIIRAVDSLGDAVFALAALAGLTLGRVPPWLLVLTCAGLGWAIL